MGEGINSAVPGPLAGTVNADLDMHPCIPQELRHFRRQEDSVRLQGHSPQTAFRIRCENTSNQLRVEKGFSTAQEDDLPRPDPHVTDTEQRCAIAEPMRSKLLELFDKAVRYLLRRDGAINGESALSVLRCETLFGLGIKSLLKLCKLIRTERDTDRRLVAAALTQLS